MTLPNRKLLNQALSKALAFKNVGKEEQAKEWARKLVKMIEEVFLNEGKQKKGGK